MITNTSPDFIRSPCINLCALDEDDICVGCHRSGDEILQWSQLTNDEKRAVMQKVAERERLHQERLKGLRS